MFVQIRGTREHKSEMARPERGKKQYWIHNLSYMLYNMIPNYRAIENK